MTGSCRLHGYETRQNLHRWHVLLPNERALDCHKPSDHVPGSSFSLILLQLVIDMA
jgi:hypothetical protein